MDQQIERLLLQLGAPTGRLGYAQMICTLGLILTDPSVKSAVHVLYPRAAELCGTKPARIERNIREEIRAIWDYGNQELLDKMFFNRRTYRPGNKEFLYTLARHLYQDDLR